MNHGNKNMEALSQPLRLLATVIASVSGVGFIKKGGGTVAAALFCLFWYYANAGILWQWLLLIVILIAGVWSAQCMQAAWGHDSNKVVIDEVAGMLIGLLWAPAALWYWLVAFVLFRFFDIVKPLGIKKMEALPGGWGVMADDVLAGIYTLIVMRTIAFVNF